MIVNGTLIAIGSSTDSIRFTSAEPNPNPGKWSQISLRNTSIAITNVLQYCIVEYGGIYAISKQSSSVGLQVSNSLIWRNTYGIYLDGARGFLNNSVIKENTNAGVRAFSKVNVSSCTIAQNGGIGIDLTNSSLDTIRYNVIYSNNIAGVGGTYSWQNSIIENNTIVGNANGITNISNQSGTIRNNIIADNFGNGLSMTGSPAPTIKFNDVYANYVNFSGFSALYGDTSGGLTNRNGIACDPFSNIVLDPLLDTLYQLTSLSPCINAGDTLSSLDPDGTINDIGAYYYPLPPTTVEPDVQLKPNCFALSQNYPNPFNPSTTIKYALPQASHVNLSVYNTLGQRVALLVDEKQEAGYHEVNFNASGITSGVYFYRLQAGDYIETKKLILMK